uniref:Uncharacterized protein n=1 Tax=Kalanchoe fedtschenkoi TaxID=63787 RepID=A0A7N0UNA5_KALFE
MQDGCLTTGEMMGRGAAGGCGMEEKPCPVSRAPTSIPADIPARKAEGGGLGGQGVELFSQAEKTLTELSPYDIAPSEKDGGQASGSVVTNLPSGLVGLLAKYTDSRRRHKKSNSGVDSNKKASIRQKRCGKIWMESEMYFRELTLADLETLFELSKFLTSDCMRHLSIPEIGDDAAVTNSLHSANAAGPLSEPSISSDIVAATDKCGNELVAMGVPGGSVASAGRRGDEISSSGVASDIVAATGRSDEEMISIGAPSDTVAAACRSGDEMVSNGVASDIVAATGRSDEEMISIGAPSDTVAAACRSGDEMVSIEVLDDSAVSIGDCGDEMVVDDDKLMEKEDKQETRNDVCHGENKSSPHSSPGSSASVEWVLGSKNKILLASERPSKKRKLLGEDAGLQKLIVSQPCEGNPNLCHFCSQGDNESEPSNRLIACSTCGVAVHRKCYGVEENDTADFTWMCSWCKYMNHSGEVAARHISGDIKPCLLCPKQGGALKPLKTNEAGNLGHAKFAHLFCSQWMPEVFVEDTKLMEPIVNVDGIKETRRKLICSICKVKYGACVRCSNGTCRASFHPICAREANHRTEIWGKADNIDVELRAFCSKHSDIPAVNEDIQRVDSPLTIEDGTSQSQAMTSFATPPNGHNESNCKKEDTCDMQLEAPGVSKKLNGELVDLALQNGAVGTDLEQVNCRSEQSVDAEALQINHIDGVKPSVASILKTFIDRGKVNVEEIALEMGLPPDSLAATLATGILTPESQYRAISWLRSHACLGSFQRNIRLKIKSAVCSGSKPVDVTLEPDAPIAVPVKSVPPRRRTHSNMTMLEADRNSFLLKDKLDNESMLEETQVNNFRMEPNGFTAETSRDCIEKVIPDPLSISSVMEPSTNGAGSDTLAFIEPKKLSFATGGNVISDPGFAKEVPPSYLHMSVYEMLMQLKSNILFSEAESELNVLRLKKVAQLDSSSSDDGKCHNHETKNSAYSETCKNGIELEQLTKAKVLGVFDMAPEDEVEGELVYFQQRLLGTKLKRKRFSDGLVSKAVKSLPSQIDFVRSQRWDSVFVNKYLAEVREVKKQGRKEKRHKEAQAVLAAATAAAASFPRISTFRKQDLDESSSQENLAKAGHALRPSSQSQLFPRPKEMMSRVALQKVTPEKQSDFFQSNAEFGKENPRSCDVCRRPETILNSIIVCSICKVAVHLDCYRSVKDFKGPWQCELCEDMASRCPGPLPMNSSERPIPNAECVACGGTVGAFRKSADCRWIHAFCAEWTLQSTFRRGQTDPVEGLESIAMGNDACCICRIKKGVSLKCHYGHCQSTFHPSCARSAGFYMNIKSSGSKIQHKAYCGKHSSEQRLKDENQKHGTDDLKSVKQVRVELERLRLLCERIVRREKLKRDLLICSHDILASKRDSVAFSALVRSPFFRPDISSDSATTSLYNSGSEAIQKSDGMTVDSTSSVKKPPSLVGSMENDRKTDDSSTSQLVFARKHTQRMPCAGKKIPNRTLSISRNLSDDSSPNRLKFRKL